MLLNSIVQNIQYKKIQGSLSKHISSIAYDSREVTENSLFVAISGFTVDGHSYIKQAIKRGATAVILEKNVPITDKSISVLKVSDSRDALANASVNFYKHPSKKLNLIGITGTNGKTSITYFLKSIFEQANKKNGLIGTNGIIINDQNYFNNITTPESLNLQHILSNMVKLKTEYCIMETSSHALHLNRVAYNNFDTAIFTNLTPDHLELHKNMDEYFNAKAELLRLTTGSIIINIDDPYGQQLYELANNYNINVITYGLSENADIYPTEINYSFDGTTYIVNTPNSKAEIKLSIPGDIYVYNSLASVACAYYNKIPMEHIQNGISKTRIDGRFEVIYDKGDFKVIIDFAHTEDALEKTLKFVKTYTKGRLILVFGVYADLSENGTSKRMGMGKVAAKYADLSIVTSDNPKHNNPDIILEEISQTIKDNNGNHKVIKCREKAIQAAIQVSNKNDVILITGKGHETSQKIGDKEIPLNEREIVLDTFL